MLFHLVIMVFLCEVLTNRPEISRPSGHPCCRIPVVLSKMSRTRTLKLNVDSREIDISVLSGLWVLYWFVLFFLGSQPNSFKNYDSITAIVYPRMWIHLHLFQVELVTSNYKIHSLLSEYQRNRVGKNFLGVWDENNYLRKTLEVNDSEIKSLSRKCWRSCLNI